MKINKRAAAIIEEQNKIFLIKNQQYEFPSIIKTTTTAPSRKELVEVIEKECGLIVECGRSIKKIVDKVSGDETKYHSCHIIQKIAPSQEGKITEEVNIKDMQKIEWDAKDRKMANILSERKCFKEIVRMNSHVAKLNDNFLEGVFAKQTTEIKLEAITEELKKIIEDAYWENKYDENGKAFQQIPDISITNDPINKKVSYLHFWFKNNKTVQSWDSSIPVEVKNNFINQRKKEGKDDSQQMFSRISGDQKKLLIIVEGNKGYFIMPFGDWRTLFLKNDILVPDFGLKTLALLSIKHSKIAFKELNNKDLESRDIKKHLKNKAIENIQDFSNFGFAKPININIVDPEKKAFPNTYAIWCNSEVVSFSNKSNIRTWINPIINEIESCLYDYDQWKSEIKELRNSSEEINFETETAIKKMKLYKIILGKSWLEDVKYDEGEIFDRSVFKSFDYLIAWEDSKEKSMRISDIDFLEIKFKEEKKEINFADLKLNEVDFDKEILININEMIFSWLKKECVEEHEHRNIDSWDCELWKNTNIKNGIKIKFNDLDEYENLEEYISIQGDYADDGKEDLKERSIIWNEKSWKLVAKKRVEFIKEKYNSIVQKYVHKLPLTEEKMEWNKTFLTEYQFNKRIVSEMNDKKDGSSEFEAHLGDRVFWSWSDKSGEIFGDTEIADIFIQEAIKSEFNNKHKAYKGIMAHVKNTTTSTNFEHLKAQVIKSLSLITEKKNMQKFSSFLMAQNPNDENYNKEEWKEQKGITRKSNNDYLCKCIDGEFEWGIGVKNKYGKKNVRTLFNTIAIIIAQKSFKDWKLPNKMSYFKMTSIIEIKNEVEKNGYNFEIYPIELKDEAQTQNKDLHSLKKLIKNKKIKRNTTKLTFSNINDLFEHLGIEESPNKTSEYKIYIEKQTENDIEIIFTVKTPHVEKDIKYKHIFLIQK
ncbi:MAG: hypothetical protein HRT98_02540 [Mycoplasmatales bacterium]|nr:hypothetical protein [Mycoplasmatales bacterium]